MTARIHRRRWTGRAAWSGIVAALLAVLALMASPVIAESDLSHSQPAAMAQMEGAMECDRSADHQAPSLPSKALHCLASCISALGVTMPSVLHIEDAIGGLQVCTNRPIVKALLSREPTLDPPPPRSS